MNIVKYDVLKDEMKAIHLETARLLIRNYIDTDEDGYLTIFQDEKSMAMDGDKVIMKKNDIFYHRIAMIKDRELVFLSLADKVNNSFIGYVLLNKYPEEQNDAITLGCSLVPEYQSKGYGFEALKSRLFQKSISFCFGVRKNDRFQNLPIFSPVEAFLPKNKFLNFFGCRAEKLCIFAPLFENSKISEND